MDLSKLREICKRYGAPEYFTEPIPEDMAVHARARLQIGSSEIIVALIDVTMGDGDKKREIAITDQAICWWNVPDEIARNPPQRLSWAQLRERPVFEKKTLFSNCIDFGDGLAMQLHGAKSLSDRENHVVKSLLIELKGMAEESPPNRSIAKAAQGSGGAVPGATVAIPRGEMIGLSKLRDACNRYKGSAKEYFVDPIPDDKAANAQKSLKIPLSQTMIALIDLTTFGGAKESIVVTDAGLYWKELGDVAPTSLSWAEFRQRAPVERQGLINKSIEFGAGVRMRLTQAKTLNERDNHVVIELMNSLRSVVLSAAPEDKPNVETPAAVTGMVECEFCNGTIKPDVTYCKHCGNKLRG